ncbi:MAG TPA: carbohydrate ABC transporter permease [Mycobacteriales bacterium]|nr:carbohydrate ABC transporter permease [Mycobacteriales bacterium]
MKPSRFVRPIGIALILFWSLAPVYWAINTSLQSDATAQARPAHYFPPDPTLVNFRTLLGIGKVIAGYESVPDTIRRGLINIVVESGVATIVTVFLALLAAYAFARMTFRFHKVIFYAVLATMALPAYSTLIPLYRIMITLHLVNTYTGIVLVYVSGFLPIAMWVLYSYLSGIPRALEEAGAVDGASRMQVLWRIVVPVARPGIIATATITFLFGWSQFLFPLVLSSDSSTQPLTVVIASLQARHSAPFTLMNSAGVVAIVIPALITVLLNKYVVNGMLAGSVK